MNEMSKRTNEMVTFVESVINDNNQHENAHANYNGCGAEWEEIEISFVKNHSDNYKKVVAYAVNMGGLIMRTDPLTLATVIRFDEKY